MKKWYVSYTISTEIEAETFDDAKAAAEQYAEDEDFYHLINDIEVDCADFLDMLDDINVEIVKTDTYDD